MNNVSVDELLALIGEGEVLRRKQAVQITELQREVEALRAENEKLKELAGEVAE